MSESNPRSSLIHQINSLIWQETVRNVLRGVLGCSHEGFISVTELVVGLITLSESQHDLEGLIHCWFWNNNWLETTLKSRILLNMLAILIQCGGSNALQLTSGQSWLENIGGINSSFSGSRSNESVNLINHKNNIIILLDLIHQFLQSFLKLSSVLGSCYKQTHIQCDHLLAFDSLWHIPTCDALSKSFGNSSFSDSRLTDQAWVVLGTTAKNLSHTLNLLCSPHHWIQASLLGPLGKVCSILFQCRCLVRSRRSSSSSSTNWVLRLSNHANHLSPNLLWVGPERLQHSTRHSLTFTEQSQQNMLGTNVVVSQLTGLLQRQLQHTLGTRCKWNLHGNKSASSSNHLLYFHTGILQSHPHGLQHLGSNTCRLPNKSEKNLFRAHKVMTQSSGLFLGKHHYLDSLLSKPLKHHLGSHDTSSVACSCPSTTSAARKHC
mmetsp:Transcript_9273/g.18422  ORF Transcript_9273/g.18422 Transcript_9273/m.18422 type:complete len:435 (-) Transcript_9273:265-1569(-)